MHRPALTSIKGCSRPFGLAFIFGYVVWWCELNPHWCSLPQHAVLDILAAQLLALPSPGRLLALALTARVTRGVWAPCVTGFEAARVCSCQQGDHEAHRALLSDSVCWAFGAPRGRCFKHTLHQLAPGCFGCGHNSADQPRRPPGGVQHHSPMLERLLSKLIAVDRVSYYASSLGPATVAQR